MNIRSLQINTSAATPFALPVPSAVRIESEEDRQRRLAVSEMRGASVDIDLASGEVESPTQLDGLAESMSSLTAPDDGSSAGMKSPDTADATQSQVLEIPVLETSPPTGSLDGQFPTSATPAPPIRMRRERSRRSSRRADASAPPTVNGPPVADLANAGTSGLVSMTRTRSGNLTRTRSGEPRRRMPARLDLSGIPRPSVVNTGALASAISNARMITDISAVTYPEADGIFGPLKELNEGTSDGRFLYDQEFLLQFRGYCTERPEGMAEIEEIHAEPVIEAPAPTRSRRRRSVRSHAEGNLPTPAITADGNTLTIPATPLTAVPTEDGGPIAPLPATSLSAFSPSYPPISMGRTGSRGGRSRNGSNATKPPLSLTTPVTSGTLPPPIPMMRSTSHGSSRPVIQPSGLPPPSPLDRRSKSLRARKRSSSTRTDQPPLPSGTRSMFPNPPMTPGLDDVKPLEHSENRWKASSIPTNRTGILDRTILSGSSVPEVEPLEVVERKVKALLNKLTMEKFDSISDQIVAWANKSESETDGRTLTLVIRLVFDKATDEATWSSMYAALCKKMHEQLSPNVMDESVRDKHGQLVVGGQLFRQYLLSRCQADFERGWSTRETLEEQQSAAAAASGVAPGEEVFSDEYYALQKAKRRGLGLVKFIGELFKLQMLTERIMHRCILKLLDEPVEEDIESVCQLLKTVGLALSGPKGKEPMDMYFGKMRELSQEPTISQRIRFMLLDVIDLRARNWIPKTQIAAPTTLAEIHEAAAKESGDKTSVKPIPIARGSSRRGQNRSHTGTQRDPEASWIPSSQLGRSVGKAGGVSLTSTVGSTSTVADSLRSPISAKSPPPTSGIHSMSRLSSEPGTTRMTRNPSEPGRTRSRRGGDRGGDTRQVNRRTSVDLVQLDAAVEAGSAGRKRLQLLPRTIGSIPNTTEGDQPSEALLSSTVEEPPSMTEDQAKAKVEEDIKEFLQIRDLNEAVGYFESMPSNYRHLLVDKFVSKMDSKDSDVALIMELFSLASTSGACSPTAFEQGFLPTVEALDDISLDVPNAYPVMARLLRASNLSRETVIRLAASISIYGDFVVHPKEKLLAEFDATS